MNSKTFLNDINNLSAVERAEFVDIVKTNLSKFFYNLEAAIVSKNIPEINQLLHKVKPSVFMLELNELSHFISEIEKHYESNHIQIESLLNQLQTEKVALFKLGWI